MPLSETPEPNTSIGDLQAGGSPSPIASAPTPTSGGTLELVSQDDFSPTYVKLRLSIYEEIRNILVDIKSDKPTIILNILYILSNISLGIGLGLLGNLIYSKRWPKDEAGLYFLVFFLIVIYILSVIKKRNKINSVYGDIDRIISKMPEKEQLVKNSDGKPAFSKKKKSNRKGKGRS